MGEQGLRPVAGGGEEGGFEIYAGNGEELRRCWEGIGVCGRKIGGLVGVGCGFGDLGGEEGCGG